MKQNQGALKRSDTRRRILDAAETLARNLGPAHLSLDAVAAEAGVSKGGLLYHFPSKIRLFEAMVADHLDRLDLFLRGEEERGRPDAVIAAYLRHFYNERRRDTPPSAGLLAVFAANPQLLEPIRNRQQAFLERIRANARDPDAATIAFLAVEGIRSGELLGTLPIDRLAVQRLVLDLQRTFSE
ncbi:TetR/AcrR family transcriptional regulator [Pararhodobacter sp. SW119]|uniref:TetR/AcrR family transcriptional regulator n=1 Tax=Pararhodobacter sp. SW119 TaxID=2780075 RepID=UPI001ADFF217|nr:TetR/AcrR family transcriptional regulator [Pararhodobacter sp. SW119]